MKILNQEQLWPTPQDLRLKPSAAYQARLSYAEEDLDWNTFLAATPGGHYVQTSHWARIKARYGWRMLRIVVAQDGRIVAGAQLLLRRLSFLGTIGYVPKGPLLADTSPELLRYMLDTLHQVARAQRVRYLAIQPPSNGRMLARQLDAQGFLPQPKLGTCTATILIDLSPDLDALLAQIKKRTRANIRRAQELGVTVREGSASDLEAFYQLLVIAGRRKNFPIYSRGYYTALWNALEPHGQIKLFIAEYAGEPVSAQLAIAFGDTLYSHVSAWSGLHGSCKPNEALDWAAIVWAKTNGYRFFDFEGINPSVAYALLHGQPLPSTPSPDADPMVTSYKLGFGGQITLLPVACDHLYNPLLRRAYRSFFPLLQRRRIITRVRKALSRLFQPPMSRTVT